MRWKNRQEAERKRNIEQAAVRRAQLMGVVPVTADTTTTNDSWRTYQSLAAQYVYGGWGIEAEKPPDVSKLEAVEVRDASDVLTGWREYTVHKRDTGPYLKGSRVEWKSGTLEAECEHHLSIEDCMARSHTLNACGIYVRRNRLEPRDPYTITITGTWGISVDSPALLTAFAQVACGGVVQRWTEGFRAQTVRIDHLYLVCGKAILGDNNSLAPDEVEAMAYALEEKYLAPVEITTTAMLEQIERDEREQQWLRLAHTSKRFASRSLSARPSSLLLP